MFNDRPRDDHISLQSLLHLLQNTSCWATSPPPTSFYGTRLITVFATANHLSISRTIWMQSKPSHSLSLRSNLILFYYPDRRDCPISCQFSACFPHKILYAFLFSPKSATFTSQLSTLWFDKKKKRNANIRIKVYKNIKEEFKVNYEEQQKKCEYEDKENMTTKEKKKWGGRKKHE